MLSVLHLRCVYRRMSSYLFVWDHICILPCRKTEIFSSFKTVHHVVLTWNSWRTIRFIRLVFSVYVYEGKYTINSFNLSIFVFHRTTIVFDPITTLPLDHKLPVSKSKGFTFSKTSRQHFDFKLSFYTDLK